MKIRSLCVAAVAAATLISCATSPVTVRQSYVAPASTRSTSTTRSASKKAVADAASCPVHVLELKDNRSDPTFLGTVAGRPVRSPGEGATWIGDMLSTGLQQNGVALSIAPDSPPEQHIVITEARLITAWVASLSTSMNGTVVIALRHGDGSAEEKIYRGSSTVLNWASGEGEIQGLLDAAFSQMLAKLGTDLRARCQSKSPVGGG